MRRVIAVILLGTSLAVSFAGCHAARFVAPPPPLRAASVGIQAVDVEFAEPLDRASAQDVSHYTIVPITGAPVPAVIQTATLVDTLYGRVVRLAIPAWLSTTDSTQFDLTTAGVVDAEGVSTGTRTLRFRTGLSYREPVQALLDASCVSCHGPSRSDGNYRVDTYAGLFGSGTDAMPNVVAGNLKSKLVVRCKPRNSMFDLGNLDFLDYEILANWVAIYGARP